MEVWNASSKAIASYSTLPQNWFNQEWLDINRSDSHIRVLIEPWRNGVSIPFTWLGRDWTVPMLNHAPVHHLHIIFFTSIWLPWFQVWPVNSLAGDFCPRPTLIQYLLPSVSVPPAVHIWFPPILEWLRQASTASGSGPQPWYRVGTGIYHTDDATKKTNFKYIHCTLALPKARSRTKNNLRNVAFEQKPHMFPSPNRSARLLHARETVKVPGNEWYFLEAEASV